MSHPHTWYFGNLYWRGRGGKDQGVQIFISDKPGILIHAKALAKGKASVRLRITGMHYDKYDRNDEISYDFYEFKNGDFINK